MNWAYAGFMFGEQDPQDMPATFDVQSVFGAVGDGVADDTAAFEQAISTIAVSGTIFVPEGVYKITRVRLGHLVGVIIHIKSDNAVLWPQAWDKEADFKWIFNTEEPQ